MNMIERVAKALAVSDGANFGHNPNVYMELARAAINAMHGATGAMTQAGQDRRNANALFTRDDAYHVFDAMIDAALKESNELA